MMKCYTVIKLRHQKKEVGFCELSESKSVDVVALDSGDLSLVDRHHELLHLYLHLTVRRHFFDWKAFT